MDDKDMLFTSCLEDKISYKEVKKLLDLPSTDIYKTYAYWEFDEQTYTLSLNPNKTVVFTITPKYGISWIFDVIITPLEHAELTFKLAEKHEANKAKAINMFYEDLNANKVKDSTMDVLLESEDLRTSE